jgi:hypothetical protein
LPRWKSQLHGAKMSYPKRGAISLAFSVTGWVFAIFLAVGLALAVPGVIFGQKALALQLRGVETTGQVVGLWQGSHGCGEDNRDTCADFNLRYRFEADGRGYEHSGRVSDEVYFGLEVGGPVRVLYLAGDPAVSAVDIGETVLLGGVFLGLALVFGLIGGIGLAYQLRAGARLVWMRDNGTARVAEVTGQEATGLRVNQQVMWVMRWRDSAGAEGRSRAQAPGRLPAVGAKITVYADPEGVLPPVWEGDSGTR